MSLEGMYVKLYLDLLVFIKLIAYKLRNGHNKNDNMSSFVYRLMKSASR